nr:FoF1 ATP synthase subunit a [Mycoplasma haemocanis]
MVLTLIFLLVSRYYAKAVERAEDYSSLPGLAFLIFMVINWIKRNTYQICGEAYERVAPFFIYIMSFFWFSNIISIIGFDSIGTSIVVPAFLALVVFLGTVVTGMVYRGIHYFGDYLHWVKYKNKKIIPIVDPLKVIGELSKILSLACRLWGNTLAGSLIIFIVYKFSENLFNQSDVDFLGLLLIPLFVFPIHLYFDVVDGTIQPLIFMLLTMCYWGLAQRADGPSKEYKHNEDVCVSLE